MVSSAWVSPKPARSAPTSSVSMLGSWSVNAAPPPLPRESHVRHGQVAEHYGQHRAHSGLPRSAPIANPNRAVATTISVYSAAVKRISACVRLFARFGPKPKPFSSRVTEGQLRRALTRRR